MSRPRYSGNDLAWLIPTKDRPVLLRSLLDSLAAQTIACGRVIVVATGSSVEDVAASFAERLPISYFHSELPGQIRQRNLGLSQLDGATPLVGFLDDDLLLAPDALERMIEFWNEVEPDTAGVGFNIVNAPPENASSLQRLFVGTRDSGRITRSGYNTRIDGIARNIRSQWLGGGYTVWRRDILDRYQQPELRTRWAIGEDIRFSYPVGKHHPLYVCAAAKVRLVPTFDQVAPDTVHRFRGRKGALAAFYFASLHPELSRIRCLGVLAAKAAIQTLTAAMRRDRAALQNARGQVSAIGTCLHALFGGGDIRAALEDA